MDVTQRSDEAMRGMALELNQHKRRGLAVNRLPAMGLSQGALPLSIAPDSKILWTCTTTFNAPRAFIHRQLCSPRTLAFKIPGVLPQPFEVL